MNNPTNDRIKLIVVGTLCLALLGVIGLAYTGKVDPQQIVTFVLTSVRDVLVAVLAFMGGTRIEQAKAAAERTIQTMRGEEH